MRNDLQGQQKLFTDEAIIKPHDYQSETVDLVLKALVSTGVALVSLATGLGKTVIMGLLCNHRRYKRILIMSCRKTINRQNQQTIERMVGHSVDIEEADDWADPAFGQRIIIASIASLTAGARGTRFIPDLVIVDEAHRLGEQAIMLLNVYQEQGAHVVGFSATCFRRRNGWSPSQVFGEPVIHRDIRWGVKNGYLCPIRAKRVTISKVDYTRCIKGGSIDQQELLDIIGYESVMLQQAGSVAECHENGKLGLVFCVNIKHARMIAEMLQRKGVKAEYYDSMQTLDERKEVMGRFKAGKTELLCCCYTLSMGFDERRAEECHHLAILSSVNEYIQRCGRVVRTLDGVLDGCETVEERKSAIAHSDKPQCTIYDYCGISRNLQLCNAVDLMSPVIRTPRQRRRDGEQIDVEQPIDLGEAEEHALQVERDEKEQRKRDAQAEVARRAKLAADIGVELEPTDPYLGAEGSKKRREARVTWGYWYVKGVKTPMKGVPIRIAPRDFLMHWQQKLPRNKKNEWLHNAINRRLCDEG